MSGKKVTIRDVAELAKVSVPTVSRVLNKDQNVQTKNVKRVLAAVKTLNYKPNPKARGLRGNKSYILGLIYDNPNDNYVINVQQGMLARCREEGYDLMIHPCDHKDDRVCEEILDLSLQGKVDGLLLTPPLSDMRSLLEMLSERHIPFVRISPASHEYEDISIYSDEEQSSFDMMLYLLSLGHRRIAFIKGHLDHGVTAQRFGGYKEALSKKGIEIDESLIKQGSFSFESGKACAQEILSMKNRPTAIFASNDEMAVGAMQTAFQMGFSVPKDISIAGFDDIPLAEKTWPLLTTVRQPIKELAKVATDRLIHILQGDKKTQEQRVLQCKVVIRDSTAVVYSDHNS